MDVLVLVPTGDDELGSADEDAASSSPCLARRQSPPLHSRVLAADEGDQVWRYGLECEAWSVGGATTTERSRGRALGVAAARLRASFGDSSVNASRRCRPAELPSALEARSGAALAAWREAATVSSMPCTGLAGEGSAIGRRSVPELMELRGASNSPPSSRISPSSSPSENSQSSCSELIDDGRFGGEWAHCCVAALAGVALGEEQGTAPGGVPAPWASLQA
ncbi:hypothetical protein E2562_008987 [Oryza meyeriana var. granulata]|uniref:Uncharacterized protein n=1 Tax=Oryza meyeriana var. granulata TaxID=110450 RepID=A0A6G1CZA7_9ORYZ|nr:hypothetical protein E2562_008987 [Oryza meyeriana var. granulata]